MATSSALLPSVEGSISGTFAELGVCEELCNACEALGYKGPTTIQKTAIPSSLEGKDIIGISQTGSGKTAAFGIPILQHLLQKKGALKALVLCPTRELAGQVATHFQKLVKGKGIKIQTVTGGVDMAEQAIQLSRKPHVVVATPGRIRDHIQNTKGFQMDSLRFLVIDEADKMLDMDFAEDLDTILSHVPRNRQTALFSATLTAKVEKLRRASLRDPVLAEVQSTSRTVATLQQYYIFVPYQKKQVYLAHLINLLTADNTSIVVFCEACWMVRQICLMLRNLGHRSLPLSGKMTQDQRQTSLAKFAEGQVKLLICTDVAGRGLDIPHVDCVINYSIPLSTKDYIHRVGRTARAGRVGKSIAVVTQYDVAQIQKIERATGVRMTEFPTILSEVKLLAPRVVEAEKEAIAKCKAHALKEKEKREGPTWKTMKQDSSMSERLATAKKRARSQMDAQFGNKYKKRKVILKKKSSGK